MSWFLLQDQKDRSKRQGVWLKTTSPSLSDVFAEIKRRKLLRFGETVEWIEIKEIRPEGKVLLEVWASNPYVKKHRHNVFHIPIAENEQWACHGDLGRGLEEHNP